MTHHTSLHVRIGIFLKWDVRTRIYLTLDPEYQGKVCGQCGDLNLDSSNDLRTRQGEVANAIVAIHSWRTITSCPVPKPLTIISDAFDSEKIAWAQTQCQIIKSQVFKVCHDLVSISLRCLRGTSYSYSQGRISYLKR